MNKVKLKKLADLLYKVDPHYFDMCKWYEGAFYKHECESSGCAFAWAATIFSDELMLHNKMVIHRTAINQNTGGNYVGFSAASYIFDITKEESYYLFADESYVKSDNYYTGISPTEVADRIMEFINVG